MSEATEEVRSTEGWRILGARVRAILSYASEKLLEHAGAVPGVGVSVALLSFLSLKGRSLHELPTMELVVLVAIVFAMDFTGALLIDPLIAEPLFDAEPKQIWKRRARRWMRGLFGLLRRWSFQPLWEEVEKARMNASKVVGNADGIYRRSRLLLRLIDKWDERRLSLEIAKAARALLFLPVVAHLLPQICQIEALEGIQAVFVNWPVGSWLILPGLLLVCLYFRGRHMWKVYEAVALTDKRSRSVIDGLLKVIDGAVIGHQVR